VNEFKLPSLDSIPDEEMTSIETTRLLVVSLFGCQKVEHRAIAFENHGSLYIEACVLEKLANPENVVTSVGESY
jgi:hypothetical protein